MKRILMVAYHFPPMAGSSGVQRTLRFAQYLPEFGWQALVLTVHPRAYESTGNDLLAEIPPDMVVRRAFALDTARHLAIGGRYLDRMAQPDRWISWKYAGIRDGMQLIRQYCPRAIWSTYPIATAHVIGAELAARSGLPWIADFRDPMAQDGYPPNPRTWQAFKRIEERVFDRAQLCTFTARSAAELYQQRYPYSTTRIEILENGYDEPAFAAAAGNPAIDQPLNPGRLTLLHSGIVYPDERDPGALFAALTRLPERNRLKVRFRAPVHEDLLRRLAAAHHIEDNIEILPALPYQDALAEMLRADGLLVLQAGNCNEQIPAKLYEYLRAGRPILACADPRGDTARLLVEAGITTIAPLDDPDRILTLLQGFIAVPTQGTLANPAAIAQASRHARTHQLATLLDGIVTP